MKIFGEHKIPVRIETEGLAVSIRASGDDVLDYLRDCRGEANEKTLLSNTKAFILHPVEPVNTPVDLTQFLMVEFSGEVAVGPKESREIFLTFPVEIGVFASHKKEYEIIDIFTLAKQKFSLYGTPNKGKICRYWKSDVFTTAPAVNPLSEGVMSLAVENATNDWIPVTRVVFNAIGMKIYYNDECAGMKAKMKVESRISAETECLDAPLKKGMKKAMEHFRQKRISVTSSNFMMEDGL